MNIVECRKCGKIYWTGSDVAGEIEAGPCCKGLPILDIERFPSEQEAIKAVPAFIRARDRAIAERTRELEAAK